jgi:hypothetical protein
MRGCGALKESFPGTRAVCTEKGKDGGRQRQALAKNAKAASWAIDFLGVSGCP